jgi:opacity protein-like surface antigen
MKKVILSLIAIAAVSNTALFAGKNTSFAVPKPVPIPAATTTKPSITPPLGMYIGGGFTYAKSECKCKEIKTTNGVKQGKNEGSTSGFNLKGGYEFNEFIGIEAKYLYTPWGDDDKALKHYGIYLKPSYAINENIDLYALLGYGKTECEYQNISENGFAWGLGGEYTLTKKENGKKNGWGVYVEYNRPLKKSGDKDITTDVANAGVVYHF